MVEELKRNKNNSVYYMSTHCNGSGKMLVKTTCEKLPQLQTAKPVSILYNKQLHKRKSRSESKLLDNQGPSFLQDAQCNGHNNRLSGMFIYTSKRKYEIFKDNLIR